MSKSEVIREYESKHPDQKILWSPLKSRIPKAIKDVFVVAEDSRFYSHSGIDYEAIKNAIVYNLTSSNRMLGASTISQQTVKNMFLSFESKSSAQMARICINTSYGTKLEQRSYSRHLFEHC